MALTPPPPETVLQEANRRRVFRVAATYVAIAYAVLEGAVTATAWVGLPDGTFRFVLGMLLLGFPLAMVLAWDYDITSRGIVRTPEDPPPEPLPEPPMWHSGLTVLGAVIVGIALRSLR